MHAITHNQTKRNRLHRYALLIAALVMSAAQAWGQYFPVKSQGRWGLIDDKGSTFMDFISSTVPVVKEDFVLITNEGRQGAFLIGTGLVVPTRYDHVEYRAKDARICFVTGGNWMQNQWVGGTWGYYDLTDSFFQEVKFSYLDTLTSDRTCRVYVSGNCNGGKCSGGQYSYLGGDHQLLDRGHYESIRPLDNGTMLVSNDSLHGLADEKGNVLIPVEFSRVTPLTGDYYLVRNAGKWGLYLAGKGLAIPAVYEELAGMPDGLIRFRDNQRWGVIDTNANVVLAPEWETIEMLSCGVMRITASGKTGIASLDGRLIIAPLDGSIWNCKDSYLQFTLNKLHGIADTSGRIVAPAIYQTVTPLDDQSWLCREDTASWIVENNGKRTRTLHLDEMGNWQGNFATFRLGSKIGLLHITGRVLLNPLYEEITILPGAVRVKSEGNWTMIALKDDGSTRAANVILVQSASEQGPNPSTFARGSSNNLPPAATATSNGWFLANNRLYGWRNRSGVLGIKPTYESVTSFSSSLTLTSTRTDNAAVYGLVDHNTGKVLTPQIYSSLQADKRYPSIIRGIQAKGQRMNLIIEGKGIVPLPLLTYVGPVKDRLMRYNTGGANLTGNHPSQLITEVWNPSIPFLMNAQIYTQGGKWGFLNEKGQIRKEAAYEYATDFNHGQAIVKLNKKWGVIDTSFAFVIPAEYDSIAVIDTLGERLIYKTISSGDRFRFMNEQGEIQITELHANARPFNNGFAVVKRDKDWAYLNEQGQYLNEERYAEAGDFSEGLARVRKLKSRYYHFIDTTGTEVISKNFSRAGQFHNGLAPAQEGQWGYINPKGEFVIPPKYDGATDFYEGVAVITRNGRKGLIGTDGKIILPAVFQKIGPFQDGFVMLKQDNRYGLATLSGEIIVKPRFSEVHFPKDGLIAVNAGFWQYLDLNGRAVIKGEFRKATDFSEGIACVLIDRNWTFINKEGVKPGRSLEWEKAGTFSEGFCPVFINSEWRFVDTNFTYLTGSFISTRSFHEGLAAVKESNGWGFIGPNGELVIPAQFEEVRDFQNGKAFVKKKGKWGIIDRNGLWLELPSFDAPPARLSGLQPLLVKTWLGLADSEGKILLPTGADKITIVNDELWRIECAGRVTYLKSDGTWLWNEGK